MDEEFSVDALMAAIQTAQQSAQDTLQTVQTLQQGLTNAGVLQKDLAYGNTGTTKFTDDIGADEAYRLATLTNANAWAHNIKSLVEDVQEHKAKLRKLELEEKELRLREESHAFRQKQKMDHLEIMRGIKAQGRNYDLPPFSDADGIDNI